MIRLIDISLVRLLIDSQFPEWQHLSIIPVPESGWDNRTFKLGNKMLIRLPSAEPYEHQVEKEQLWLPRLSPHLPLPIPIPIALGQPGYGYPFKWSIYHWLEGDSISFSINLDLVDIAEKLASFLKALHKIVTTDGPLAGKQNFYRGGPLAIYDHETKLSMQSLNNKIDISACTAIWNTSLESSWDLPPLWVHGDISSGNLLVKEGKLCGVIDFGQLCIGDPACDLAISWTLFHGKSREVFQKGINFDQRTWERARGWTLWKALITASGLSNPNNVEAKKCFGILDDLINEHYKK